MPVNPLQLEILHAPFRPHELEWRPLSTKNENAKVLCYVTSRAIMDRLDRVCGVANWCNAEPVVTPHGVIQGISIHVAFDGGDTRWITKYDGASETDIEAFKGGISGALKRAGVLWGIGRYLYGLGDNWVKLRKSNGGRFYFHPEDAPKLAAEFLPAQSSLLSAIRDTMQGTWPDDWEDKAAQSVFAYNGLHQLETLTQAQSERLFEKLSAAITKK